MILKQYIKNYLIENLKIADISVIDNIVESLNTTCKDLSEKLASQGREIYYYQHIFGYLDNIAYKNKPKLEELNEGAFRRAYSITGEEWVLKLSMNAEGAKINKEELEISQGRHGLAARDIFLKIYDYDKISDFPCWIICQKVVPMSDIDDLNILKKAFPTFWNIIKKEELNKNPSWSERYKFINMISTTIGLFGYYLKTQKPEKAFYDAANATYELIDFEDVVFYKDFQKISSAYSYIRSTDMHEGNFGLVSLKNPSPDSIVILDFDADSHI